MAYDELAQNIQKMLTKNKWWVVPFPTDLIPHGAFKIMQLPRGEGLKIKFYLTRGNIGKDSIFNVIAHMKEGEAKELRDKLIAYFKK